MEDVRAWMRHHPGRRSLEVVADCTCERRSDARHVVGGQLASVSCMAVSLSVGGGRQDGEYET